MALFDIMPHSSPHGGHDVVEHLEIHATDAFFQGDVVTVDTSGNIIQAADEASIDAFVPDGTIGALGIAAESTAKVATARSSDATQNTANSEGVTVAYYPFRKDGRYITRNFTEADDTTFDGTPAATDIGTLCSLRTDGTDWGVCSNAASSNLHFRIVDVLDTDGISVGISGKTGDSVVFQVALG